MTRFDFVVIGSGPAGQKAAIQAAKSGRSVAVVELERSVGGACVFRGTIPSKTLRESAIRVSRLLGHGAEFGFEMPPQVELAPLMSRMHHVLDAHDRYIGRQLSRNGITRIHGRATFSSATEIDIEHVDGKHEALTATTVIVAVGSRPRSPEDVPVDHEHILDSDSVLSMTYLPRSLIVLGGGVIASEYATIFASLGVQVTMIDRYERPLGWMDPEIIDRFIDAYEQSGSQFVGDARIETVAWDGVSQVIVKLESGHIISADKLLCAQGRVANIEKLGLDRIGLTPNERHLIDVDEHCRTAVPNVYAVGDVIGPPSLAASAMEQGRRAACHALDIEPGPMWRTIPIGIYAIPEMASIGMSEADARKKHGDVIVGRAEYDEIARGQIADAGDGFLKMVADPDGRLLGVQIVGEGATELIHLGQIALGSDWPVSRFVEDVFNFPTLAEAYRVAALQIAGARILAGR